PKAAGKLVKCCNPQCLVPIFSAPAIKKFEPVAPPPPPARKLPWLYIAGGLAAAGIAGVCVVIMNQTGPTELPPIVSSNTNENGAPKIDPVPDQNPNAARENPDDPGRTPENAGNDPPPAAQKLSRDALQQLAELSTKIPKLQKLLYW